MFKKVGGLIMALMGVGSFCFCLHYLWDEVLLDATGRATTGVVTEKFTDEDEDHNIGYNLTYRYEDGNGQQHTSTSDAFKSMYDIYAKGSPIPVVYSSSVPTISRIRAAGGGLLPAGMFAAMGGVSMWIGLRMLLRQIHWENKLARLTEKGERVVGRLMAVEDDKADENQDDPPQVLVYAFTDKTGQQRTGKTYHVKAGDHDFWKGRIGCALDVRVNAADSTDHIALVEESKLLG